MNLIDLSQKTGRSVDELTDIIYDKFDVIILSEYNTLHENMVNAITAMFEGNQDQQKPEKRSKAQDEQVNSNLLCWNELNQVKHKDDDYTKDLLRYCILNKYLFFIDTCSLLHRNFMDFYKMFLAVKGGGDEVLFVPYVVRQELKIMIKRNKKPAAVIARAKKILDFLPQEEQKGNIAIVGNDDDRRRNSEGKKMIHADRVIIEKLIYFRNDSRSSLFITQDYGATVDALKQNGWLSTKSDSLILVKKIWNGGILVNNTNGMETDNPKLPIDKNA